MFLLRQSFSWHSFVTTVPSGLLCRSAILATLTIFDWHWHLTGCCVWLCGLLALLLWHLCTEGTHCYRQTKSGRLLSVTMRPFSTVTVTLVYRGYMAVIVRRGPAGCYLWPCGLSAVLLWHLCTEGTWLLSSDEVRQAAICDHAAFQLCYCDTCVQRVHGCYRQTRSGRLLSR